MTSDSLRVQAAQKEREWRELEQLQYVSFVVDSSVYAFSSVTVLVT